MPHICSVFWWSAQPMSMSLYTMLMVVWMKGIPCCHALHRGVLNIVHGTHDVVNYMLDHPDIKAISFVGSDQAGRYIYSRGCANGKRVQSNMGAKVSHASFCCCQARICVLTFLLCFCACVAIALSFPNLFSSYQLPNHVERP
mmetsp:Transcript_40631/g.121183  ORF Transcript_40631/g.121183 Transcript_40631/m.121183 type:complete len:143 (-) Transcript_40631:915-1343(-)